MSRKMLLKSINVYSDYLGDSKKTKERTIVLRSDSEFLDYIFSDKIKYVNNSYLRQLNVCCSPSAAEMIISSELSEGYPQVSVPFDYSKYMKLGAEEKDEYWINLIERVFIYLAPKMKCEDGKIDQYIRCLHESDIKTCKNIVKKLYGTYIGG